MKMLTILALAAIGQLSSAAAEPSKIVVWTFADWTTGTQGDEIKRQVAAFEKANPDITVELDGKPSTDIIAGLIANGTAPGVDVVAANIARHRWSKPMSYPTYRGNRTPARRNSAIDWPSLSSTSSTRTARFRCWRYASEPPGPSPRCWPAH